jgi:hypothetical protein
MKFKGSPFTRSLIEECPLVILPEDEPGASLIQKRQLIFAYSLFYFGRGISLSPE